MNKLKELRKKAGLTQAEMGKKLGFSESGYCLIENGKRRMTVDVALKIAAILKTEPSNIFLASDFAERQEDKPTGTEGR
jgi:putative transcriptional regulator